MVFPSAHATENNEKSLVKVYIMILNASFREELHEWTNEIVMIYWFDLNCLELLNKLLAWNCVYIVEPSCSQCYWWHYRPSCPSRYYRSHAASGGGQSDSSKRIKWVDVERRTIILNILKCFGHRFILMWIVVTCIVFEYAGLTRTR